MVAATIGAGAAACSAQPNNHANGGGGSGGSPAGGNGGNGGSILTGGGGDISVGGDGGAGGGLPGSCDVSCMQAGGTCESGTCVIVENSGNVPPNVQGQLDGGGQADATFKWLYPYDQTVFPRGLLPPTLQFGGQPPDAMRITVTFPGMSYTGYFGPSNPGRAQLSAAAWKAVTLAAKASDQVKVGATKISGGQVGSLPEETWKIAQGSLHGTIYYETYGSQLAGDVGIMKIAPGAAEPSVIKTGCGNVCHTASADGSTLVAATQFPFGSAAYDLKNNAAVIHTSGQNEYVYAGVYPDGSFVISCSNYRTWLGDASRIYDTKTGQQIPTPSWDNVVTNASMPAFSPDGKWVAFNREDQGGGHALATMAYDHATNVFSNLTTIAGDGGFYFGWPAFTPDSKWVVYHMGDNSLFETDNGSKADLWIVNAQTHTVARLDQLDGYKNGQTYLPAQDPNLSFAPTVLPVPVGGYFWVVFTSHRSYGNTLPSLDNNGQNGKLWVAAIDLNPADGQDPSHPAFYLDGQEATADNLRGFWVLDPCKADATDCTTGDECCGGYCTQSEPGGPFTCSPTKMGCSNEFEKCTTAADCCDSTSECINGHCASVPPE